MAPPAPSSMNFLAPDNVRHQSRTSRGVSLSSASTSVEVSIIFATGLTGVVVAAIVYLLRFTIEQVESAKLDLVVQIWHERGALAGGAVYAGCGASASCSRRAGGRVGAVGAGVGAAAADRVPQRVQAQAVHVDARPRDEVGRRHVRRLRRADVRPRRSDHPYRRLHRQAAAPPAVPPLVRAAPALPRLRFLRNDLDQRDFVAMAAGAGVAAAFMAPLSATLFVVEEAATHFSVPLLWRAFSAAYVSMYTTHLIDRLRSGEFNGRGEFQVTFEPGTGEDCASTISISCSSSILGAICGAAGALFNA